MGNFFCWKEEESKEVRKESERGKQEDKLKLHYEDVAMESAASSPAQVINSMPEKGFKPDIFSVSFLLMSF